MDRFEQTAPIEQANSDGSHALLDSIRELTPHARLNVEHETTRVADLLSQGTQPEFLEAGVQRLSTGLQTLSQDMGKYNQLLKGVSENISDEPTANPMIFMSDFNHATGTWNKVTVNTYNAEEGGNKDQAYRIVQPGNTLSQIARDLHKDINKDPNRTAADYMDYLQEINGITDANKINVGQAIKLHKTRG